MKHFKTRSFILAAAVLILSLMAPPLFPGDDKKPAPEQQEQMKRLKELTTPGPEHQHLKYFIGDWTSEVRTFVAPDAPPLLHKETIHVRPVFDGRFNQAEISGVSMGQPYKILVFVGYDKLEKSYFTFQLNTKRTGYFLSHSGALSTDGKVRTEDQDFKSLDGRIFKTRAVTTIIDENNYTYEVYITYPQDGNEIRFAETRYKRVTKARDTGNGQD